MLWKLESSVDILSKQLSGSLLSEPDNTLILRDLDQSSASTHLKVSPARSQTVLLSS